MSAAGFEVADDVPGEGDRQAQRPRLRGAGRRRASARRGKRQRASPRRSAAPRGSSSFSCGWAAPGRGSPSRCMISRRSFQAAFLSAGVRSRYEGWKVGSSGVPRYSKKRPRSRPRAPCARAGRASACSPERADDLRRGPARSGRADRGGRPRPPRPAGPGSPGAALQDVRDEDLAAREAHRADHLVEELACRPDERAARAGPRPPPALRRRTSAGPSGRPRRGRCSCAWRAAHTSRRRGRLARSPRGGARDRSLRRAGGTAMWRPNRPRGGRPGAGAASNALRVAAVEGRGAGRCGGAPPRPPRRFETGPAARAHRPEQLARLSGDVRELVRGPARSAHGQSRRPSAATTSSRMRAAIRAFGASATGAWRPSRPEHLDLRSCRRRTRRRAPSRRWRPRGRGFSPRAFAGGRPPGRRSRRRNRRASAGRGGRRVGEDVRRRLVRDEATAAGLLDLLARRVARPVIGHGGRHDDRVGGVDALRRPLSASARR